MMTNTQLYLAIGIPSVLVLISMLLNLKQTKDAEDRLTIRIDGVESSLSARLARVERSVEILERDLREFYKDLGQHDGRLQALGRAKP